MFLFAVQSSTTLRQTPLTFTQQKIYHFKLWSGGNLVRNFIPVKNSSNVVGMYDTVTGTFFTNAGTGDFTPGPLAN